MFKLLWTGLPSAHTVCSNYCGHVFLPHTPSVQITVDTSTFHTHCLFKLQWTRLPSAHTVCLNYFWLVFLPHTLTVQITVDTSSFRTLSVQINVDTFSIRTHRMFKLLWTRFPSVHTECSNYCGHVFFPHTPTAQITVDTSSFHTHRQFKILTVSMQQFYTHSDTFYRRFCFNGLKHITIFFFMFLSKHPSTYTLYRTSIEHCILINTLLPQSDSYF
jgi:hypothetical protein